MEYIVAGYNMITDIYYPDGRVIKASPGGSFYSAAGIKMWRDSVAYVGTAGSDFNDYYGKFFSDNEISTHIAEVLPKTLSYDLIYAEDGSWTERCSYGEEFEAMAKDIGRITPEMFAPLCDENTKGIYIEASLSAKIADNFPEVKALIPNGKLMWEINTEDLFDPTKKEAILERIGQVDIYSVNLHEARGFWGVETLEKVIDEIRKIGKPCFLRLGEEGAGMVTNEYAVFAPPVNVEKSVDPTGCGNCSTAASLIGYAEGIDPFETVMMANISAGFNALQVGPWPKVDTKTRETANKILNDAK
ncbi:MAG: carbohydrate kinase family protein [Eubacteriaceae bacterium]|nr:carbohydrate kinase family protein [Eubacteriaceae bacterium]